MTAKKLTVAITVGESSGDLLGYHLMLAIKAHYPQANFFGIGGPLMLSQGFKSYFKQEDLAVMGYAEVFKNLPKILTIRKKISKIICQQKPDVYIGIDAPDFNFKVEQKVHQQGIPTIHYVSPSVWAWKPKRVEKLIQFTDNILCLFPMEPAIYQQKGGNATYVGHPLASEIPLDISLIDSRTELDLPTDIPIVTLMPGSRQNEIVRLAPLFLKTSQQLLAVHPNIRFFIPITSEHNQQLIEHVIQAENLNTLPIQFILPTERKHPYIAASNLALVASGTATLEVALCKCPMVISYIVSSITYHLAKPLIKTDVFGLPNILLQNKVVPELIQKEVTTDNLYQSCQYYLTNPEQQHKIAQKFSGLHQILRQDTSKLAAEAVLNSIRTGIKSS